MCASSFCPLLIYVPTIRVSQSSQGGLFFLRCSQFFIRTFAACLLPESTDLFGSRVIRSGTPGEKGVSLVDTRAFLRHGLAPWGIREVGLRVQAKEVKARKLRVSLSGVWDVFRCYTWLRLPSLAAAAAAVAVGWEMKIKRRRKRQRSSIP